MFNRTRIFVSGATGSWGQTLIRLLLEKYDVSEIVCFSRGELQQVMMQRKFANSKLRYVIGDVRDYESVLAATRGVDYIFHLAALKHVPICEENVQETIKTNVTGTTNIVNAAIANKVKKVIDVSSDKAVEPVNLYGLTKAVGEKIIIQANDLCSDTRFVCIRGGNVMGSSGSVIPFFIDLIKSKKSLPITDRRMTRFFLTLEEAILLLFKAAEASYGGETFVMNMPACYITDLAEVLMERYGQVELKDVGIRPGEKIDEILVSHNEALLTHKVDEDYFVILPANHSTELFNKHAHLDKFGLSEFTSKTFIMNKEQIRVMLEKGNFL